MANKFPNPDGRDTIEFSDDDWSKAQQMAAIQCTGEEIAAILNVNYDTLLARIKDLGWSSFSDWYKKHSAGGKMSLRRRQFKTSETNPTMQIWLGKQYLGQKDRNDYEVTAKVTPLFDPKSISREGYKELLAAQMSKPQVETDEE